MDQKTFLTYLGIALIALAFYLYDQSKKKQKRITGGGNSILQTYADDMTTMAKNNQLDPVIGRQEEIDRVIHILARRRKNNPILLGEPGVGKTAIAEGLAQKITAGEVPDNLKKKRVLNIDLTGLISGTKYRGEFEERMRRLTEEVESMGRSVILFMDEIHVIEQSAGVEGGMNVSDILKPALARGDLQTIGATTWREYEQMIRPDDALNRRFQPVLVDEPRKKETLAILKGVKKTYENYHHVKINESALEAAVTLSKKIKDRFLPDKAIDLIDEACAKVAIESSAKHAIALGTVHSAAKKKAQLKTKTPQVTKKDIREVIDDWINN